MPRAAAKADFSAAEAILHGLGWQAVGLLGLLLHVLLARECGPVFVGIGLLALCLLYVRLPLAGLVVLWQVTLYQNLAVALFAKGIPPGTYTVLMGTNFMATALLAAIAASRLLLDSPDLHPRVRRLAWLACGAIGVALLYTALGVAKGEATSAAVYFRATTAMLLALVVGLDVGRVWGYRTVTTGFLVSLLLGVVFTLCELADPHAVYDTMGLVDFMNLKYGPSEPEWPFMTAADLVALRTTVLFNITGSQSDAMSFRFGGPNIHSISYAYVIAMGGVAALVLRQYWLFAAVLPLLFFVGVKGSGIMFLMTLGFQILWMTLRDIRLFGLIMALFLGFYVTFAITFGIQRGDFHVIGLIGGLNGFLRNPLGHGIGVGGNLSADTKEGVDWIAAQHAGTADFALESAVGVLLYQLGIGCAAIAAVFWGVLGSARPVGKRAQAVPRASDALFIAVAMIIVNGLFQEEAYSPYALGIAMVLAGVAVANNHPAAPSLSAFARLAQRPDRDPPAGMGRPAGTEQQANPAGSAAMGSVATRQAS